MPESAHADPGTLPAVQRDYILRLIEQAGTILKALLARVRSGEADRTTIAQDLRRAANLGAFDFDILRICDADGIRQLIAPLGETDPSRTWLAAEILFLDGLEAHLDGQPDDAAFQLGKARILYELLAPTAVLPSGFPETAERLREIDGLLDGGRDTP